MPYDIGIDEIICTNRSEDTTHRFIKYDAVSATRPKKCESPKCRHEIIPHVHDTKHNLLKDIRAEGKIVLIDLAIKRYRCPDCGYVFPEHFDFFNPKAHITDRLKQEFVNRRLRGETFKYIARDYGVDDKTVATAFAEYAADHLEEELITYTPRVLGIDEAHIDDHYRLVLTDVGNRRLIDMKRNNHQTTLKAYLKTLDKNICKVATMDFAIGYAKAVESVLPGTMVVIDRFHVVQEVNRCVDNVRKDIQNYYRKQGVDIRLFKHSRTLFMANLENLNDKALDIINQWFSMFPELYEAYMVKETLRDVYNSNDYKEAEKRFDAWLNDIPDYERFRAMRTTFTERKKHILNYFKYRETNAYTESVNSRIKSIEKLGRGYKFDRLRELCILSINRNLDKPIDEKEAIFVDSGTIDSFDKKVADFNKTIDEIKSLLNSGHDITSTKWVKCDERFCNLEAIPTSIRRRVAFFMDDFTANEGNRPTVQP